MSENAIEFRRGHDVVTSDRTRISVDEALGILRSTWWAPDLARETLVRAMDNSLCFGLLRASKLAGFARVVTDRTTFAYLTDVVIAAELRGHGLGSWLMSCVLDHPDLQNLRHFSLLTVDAVALYEKIGFTVGAGEQTYMDLPRARVDKMSPAGPG